MVAESDFRPKVCISNPRTKPDDWLSAHDTAAAVRGGDDFRVRTHDIARSASDGRLRTWAPLLVVGETRWADAELPFAFWSAYGPGMEENWVTGDFSTTVQRRFPLRASGVAFHRGDLATIFPGMFRVQPEADPKGRQKPEAVGMDAAKGGRKMSTSWPDWVAELVAYMHESGIPEGEGTAGVEVVLKAVADQLASRGLEGPARSTAQETMRAVLLRLRAPD
jgi:hypothetical protein